MKCATCGHWALHDMAGIGVCRASGCGCDGPVSEPRPPAAPNTFGRPSWLDRAVDEALAVCPTMQPWEVRVMLIAAAPTIQNAATAEAASSPSRSQEGDGSGAPAVPVGVQAAGIYPARPLSNTANTSQVVDFGAKWEDEMPGAVARLAAREWPDRDNPPTPTQEKP